MTYLECDECGLRTVSGPMSLVGSCPRCRLRGRFVSLVELHKAPPLAGHRSLGAPASDKGMSAPS